MRCYSTFRSIQFDVLFDRTGYQQFLRAQRLNEHDIKFLNIHFIADFTLSHFSGSDDLAAGGTFFQRGREYIEQENKTTPAFYRPVNPDNTYAAIFLRPEKCHMSADLINRTFLHETGHHIQHCRNLPCCRSRPENEVFASLEWKDRPWEIHAEKFAYDFQSNTFLQMVPHHLERSDLRYL